MEQGAGAATQRWKLLIAYDGAAFRGFAIQPEVPTVAGALRQALERTARLSEPPPITCAGRTDAGVHARGQVVHVDLPAIPYDGPGLARALNRQLAPAVVVRRAEEVGPDFDARRSATGRTYRYLVWNAPEPDPLLDPVAWHVRDPLDLRAMRTATDVLLGSHDFRSFCRRQPGTDPSEPIVRRVTMARWSVDEGPEAADAVAGGEGRLLRFEIAAGSFCHQMVRSLVASLVEVGRGRQNAAGLMERLRAAKRESGPDPAPARGLCLVSVAYASGGSTDAGRRYGRQRRHRRHGGPRWAQGRSGRLNRPAGSGRRLAHPFQGLYPGSSARGTPGSPEPSPGTRVRGRLAHHADAKDRSCAHIFTEGHRDHSGPGTSSTPTASSSGAWPPRWRPSCAASTAPTSPPTSTPATT